MTLTTREKARLRLYAFIIVLGGGCGAAYSFVLFGHVRDLVQGAFVGLGLGGLLGAFEIFLALRPLGTRLRAAPFAVHLAIRALVYLVVIVAAIELSAVLFTGGTFPAGRELLGHVAFGAILSVGFNLFFAINRLLGANVLRSFVTGAYHHPREEERVFMFLDIVGSTGIAERIGNVAFHRLLNRFCYDLTDAIVETKGEIYKYVGDEIIVTWKMASGLRDARCVRCYYSALEAIARKHDDYEREFGVVPAFRAGLHCGQVVAGELGDTKQEISFLGDTVNTTARIKDLCREANRPLLISGPLLARLRLPDGIEADTLGPVRLRGREQAIDVYGLRRAGEPLPESGATSRARGGGTAR